MDKIIILLTFLLCHLLFSVHSQLLPIVDERTGQSGRVKTYIVHVAKPNGTTTDFLSSEHRECWHRSFLPSARLESGEPRLIYSYSHAISGFAARLTPEEVEAMEAKDGFLLAVPDRTVKLQTTYTPTFLGLNADIGLWPDSNLGEGMIIGVIDTGILPSHLSFRDEGMPPPPRRWRGRCDFGTGVCNNKLIGAVAFKGGNHPSPLDDAGHGTHTAGTAAGSPVRNASVLGQALGLAVGIAPRAHVAVYKVLFGGSGQDSDVIAGIDRAIADGVDVLSMSLGSGPSELYQNGIITASFAAMQHGVFPSAAVGNSGPEAGEISNDAPWMLTVAAGTTDRRVKVTLWLGNGLVLDGESAYQRLGTIPFTELVYPGVNGSFESMTCAASAVAQFDVSGKIVVCHRSNIVVMGTNVKNAGAAAMVVLGPAKLGLFTSADAHLLPAIYLDHPDADKLVSYIAGSDFPAVASFVFRGTQFAEPKSPSVAAFSSRGPSKKNGGILKPDVIGPGVNILAAWPFGIGPDQSASANNIFTFLSGTSMATPHLSGIAALIKKVHPGWSTAAVKSAIVTTAYAANTDGGHIADQYPDEGPAASCFAMGAGHVDAVKASDPGLVYDADAGDYVGYLCGLGYTDAQVRAVVQRQVRCAAVSRVKAEDLNYPSIAVELKVGSNRTVRRTVKNVGEAKSVYEVRYVKPRNVDVVVTPSALAFSAAGEKRDFAVQFKSSGGGKRGEVVQGELVWVKGQRTVRSPIVVTFS